MASKRTVLITGCSDDGLGSALALAFKRAGGWRVFASARNMSKLKKVEDAGIGIVQLDTLSDESIASSVTQVQKLTGGSLDVLVNNAGAGYSMPLMDLDIDEARKLFNLYVWSLISVTRAFLPLLMQSLHGGMVVNNTSIASTTVGATPFSGAYNASKAAAVVITENMRLELEPFGIKAINLMTGSIRTNFFQNQVTAALPPTSLYNVAKQTVEKTLSGAHAANGSDPDQWAEYVVGQLSKRNPSYWIWRGAYTLLIRVASHFPIGLLDSMVRTMVGLDEVAQKVKEQGGPSKIKLS